MSSSTQKPPRRTPSDDEIPSLLAELDASGESLAAFARARGLSTWKLYRARRQAPSVQFDPVRVVGPVAEEHDPIELVHASGHRLVLPAGFDADSLRRLLEVLSSC